MFKKILFSVFLFLLLSEKSFSFEDFPEAEDKILVLQNCVLCHSPKLVSAQRMTKKSWDKTLKGMEKDHNLVFVSGEVREKILSYLSKHFKPESKEQFESPMGLRIANQVPKV